MTTFTSGLPTELIKERECNDIEEAQALAGKEVANTGGFSVPVIMFRQGNRINLTGAIPMSWVSSRLAARSADRKGQIHETLSAWNRPEDPDHAETIAKYLKENHDKKYILPPLTLNVQQPVNLYILNVPSTIRPAYLVIPATAKLAITDGQHRRSGIIRALQALEAAGEEGTLPADAIAVMITCETETAQIHQDFADCSKTKALPPSLLAVYDRRNPANRLVIELAEMCPLFKGRIDSTNATLSKKSTFLFLTNQVRQLVKELLAGSYALADVEFEKRAIELLLHTDTRFQEERDRFAVYINYLTEVIPVWKEIAALPPATMQASQIPVKRAEGWVCLTATGLNLIGRVGHHIFRKKELEENWKQYAERLGTKIDWSREADIWQGSIVQEGKKGLRILTARTPLMNAFEKVCQQIGLPAAQSQSGNV